MRVLLLFIFSLNLVFAQDNVIEIILPPNKSIIKVGEHLDLKLTSPTLSFEEIKAKVLEAKEKIPPFHIVEIQGESPEYYLRAIYENAYKSADQYPVLNLGEAKFALKGSEFLDTEPLKLDPKFFVYEKSEVSQKVQGKWWKFFFLILLFLGLIFFAFKVVVQQLRKRKERRIKTDWYLKMKKVSTREDYESIYKARDEWKVYYPLVDVNNFLNTLDKYQYKKSWSQEDNAIVTKSFERLRDYGI